MSMVFMAFVIPAKLVPAKAGSGNPHHRHCEEPEMLRWATKRNIRHCERAIVYAGERSNLESRPRLLRRLRLTNSAPRNDANVGLRRRFAALAMKFALMAYVASLRKSCAHFTCSRPCCGRTSWQRRGRHQPSL